MPHKRQKPIALPDDFPEALKRLRDRLKLTQAEFARRYYLSPSAVQDWEQGRRKPDGPAIALLSLVSQKPEAIAFWIHRARQDGLRLPKAAPAGDAAPAPTDKTGSEPSTGPGV
jgi:transcriptional regulator with XRE-family HTH domain